MRRRALLAASGASGGDLIRFSIKSPNPDNPILNREAVRNMTWAEWVNSYYNLKYADIDENGFYSQYFEVIYGIYICHYEEGWDVAYPQGGYVRPDDIIIENLVYSNKA